MSTFDLQAHVDGISYPDTYDVPDQYDFTPGNDDPSQLLEAAVEAVADASNAITNPEVFDMYRCILKHADIMPSAVMSKLLDSISSGLMSETDATSKDLARSDQNAYMEHKLPLEMYTFLLHWFTIAVEYVKEGAAGEDAPAPRARKGRGGKAAAGKASGRGAKKSGEALDWASQIPTTLGLIQRVLNIHTQRIWTTSAERETFIKCLTNPAYHISQNEGYMKSEEIRLNIYRIICRAVKHQQHAFAAQINIMQNLQFHEHLSEPMAQCLTVLVKEFDHHQLSDEILREIAGKTFTSQDSKGTRAFSKFLICFAELSPRSILKQLPLLLAQLDSEAYPMRIAIVEIVGALLRELMGDDPSAEDRNAIDKQVAGLYGLLLERMLDLSSYVRVKVLSVLSRVCEMRRPYPRQRLSATTAAVGALEDKVASVRKGAVALLIKLMQTHPWAEIHGGPLKLDVFLENYKEVKARLALIERQMGQAMGVPDGGDEEGTNEENEGGQESQNDETMDVDEPSQADDDNGMPIDDESQPRETSKKKGLYRALTVEEQAILGTFDAEELERCRLKKKYYAEAMNFTRHVQGAMDIIIQLLGSTSKAEVLEAIEFFKVAQDYEIEGADLGITRMLHLIWHKDNSATGEDGKELKGVRSRLLECYRELYFEPDLRLDRKTQVNKIAGEMIKLTYDATLAELTSLEEMLRIMMDDNQIHADVIDKLWTIYSSNRPLAPPQRRGAILILGMMALASRNVLTDHVDVMLKIGLSRVGKTDLTLGRYTCVALQRLNGSAKKVKGSLEDKTIRLSMDNPIFQRLQETVQFPSRHKEWFGFAEQAINTVYALGERPDQWCNELIKQLTRRAFEIAPAHPSDVLPDRETSDTDNKMDEDLPDEHSQTSETPQAPPSSTDVGDAFKLSQLLFVVGHVAIKQIVFLELVEREWKRQKDEQQSVDQKAARADASRAAKAAEDLDAVVGNAEDEIGDRIHAVRETELLYGPDALLALYGPMLVNICGSPQNFKSKTLRAAATLSLSKFLCISSQFCEDNHRLLFRILEISKSASIRSNIVIALGDVAVSYSSIIDENSSELYKGLSDKDMGVKKNTLMVLTHLILNGMVKVKGQLGEMAKCLEDSDPRIADLAKLFFTELSTKDNAIYNNLPDIISHLSVGEHAVDEETFQSTMKYIFTFIEKEKQAENIVEKLCQRFRLSEEPRQWRDVAFCLSLLPFKSERSVKKLIEGLPFYRDKLHEEGVFTKFTEILVKARQNKSPTKPDNELNEFEQILEEHRQQGEADQALEQRVKGKKGKKKAPAKRSARNKRVADDAMDEQE